MDKKWQQRIRREGKEMEDDKREELGFLKSSAYVVKICSEWAHKQALASLQLTLNRLMKKVLTAGLSTLLWRHKRTSLLSHSPPVTSSPPLITGAASLMEESAEKPQITCTCALLLSDQWCMVFRMVGFMNRCFAVTQLLMFICIFAQLHHLPRMKQP